MNGPQLTSTGEVISSNLHYGATPNAENKFFYGQAFLYGQVVAIYQRNSPQNSNGAPGWVTYYDVLALSPSGEQELVRKCIHMQPVFGGGPNNYLETVQPNPGPNAQSSTQPPGIKMGHTVIVAFLNGRRDTPIIIGGVPHPSPLAVEDRPLVAEGTVTRGEIQGLFFQVNNDGELEITFNGPRDDKGKFTNTAGPTNIKISKDGSVSIVTKDGQKVALDRVNKRVTVGSGAAAVVVDSGAGKIRATGAQVEIGSGGLQPMVLGNDLKAVIQELCQALQTLTVICAAPGTPSGPPVNAPMFGVIASKLDSILSTNHKVSK